MTLLYNLLMLAVDVAVLRFLGRRKGFLAACGTAAAVGAVSLALASILGGIFEDHFGFFRLWAYAVFGHCSALAVGTAILWRRQRPGLAVLATLSAAVVLGIGVDAFLVEPHWLDVSHRKISSPKIHRPIRIVVVADLQAKRVGSYERDVLRRVMEEKPDLILFAGDWLQVYQEARTEAVAELHDALRDAKIAAPLGAFAVQGNVDPFGGWRNIFEGLGITTIDDRQTFDLGDLELTCIGLFESVDRTQVIGNPQPERFHVVLGHIPNFALGKIDADLLVAGHTHGGQVRLPLVGPLITHAAIPNRWAAGLTDLPGGGRLLVSRGIGMERGYAPPMRFLCRPELAVIDLVPEEGEGTKDESRY